MQAYKDWLTPVFLALGSGFTPGLDFLSPLATQPDFLRELATRGGIIRRDDRVVYGQSPALPRAALAVGHARPRGTRSSAPQSRRWSSTLVARRRSETVEL